VNDELPVISDRVDAARYEARVDGELAGTRRFLLHTEVLPAFEGRGIGSALARHILDAARASGARVTVKCPFIRTWLARHPDYMDVVTPDPVVRPPGG
jgi:hypothetical protein